MAADPISPGTGSAAPRVLGLGGGSRLRIAVMDQGATWLSCSVPLADGSRREVLLGCPAAADYAGQSAYLGATIGRYANRIAGARFAIGGREYRLLANQGGNTLHGGPQGFDTRRWTVESACADEIVFLLESAAGDQGFPGHASVWTRYRLEGERGLTIEHVARLSQACPLSLTNHAYFNLDGETGDARAQRLRIAAERFVAVDPALLPLGEPVAVAGTGFDFRAPKQIRAHFLTDAQQQVARGYDHSFLLDAACRSGLAPAAVLESADGRLRMSLSTNLPALQFYSGNYLAGTPARSGGVYADHAGIALEPGYPPDSPNDPAWQSCIVHPGAEYRSFIRFEFEV